MADEPRPLAGPEAPPPGAPPPDSLSPGGEGQGEGEASAAPNAPPPKPSGPAVDEAWLARLPEKERSEVRRFLALSLTQGARPQRREASPLRRLLALLAVLAALILAALLYMHYQALRNQGRTDRGPPPCRRPSRPPPLRLSGTPPGALDGPLPVPEDLVPPTAPPPPEQP